MGKRDALLWNYESVELFLARGKESAQFIVAPDNCLLDAFNAPGNLKGASFKWNCPDIRWSTLRKDKNCWEGSLTIPLDQIRFSEAGKKGEYRFNAYRDCRYVLADGTNKWEQSCYLPTFGSFLSIDRFGTLTLGK
ncbi:MAG: hypothetical protein IJS14_05225 [Lentisphaeria bacterium]|nr:hypothetical protein [Lentisphaeria bacterium]